MGKLELKRWVLRWFLKDASMREYGAETTLQLIGVDIGLLSIAIIFYWNSQDTGTILQLLLKVMVTPRLCGTLSKNLS